MKSIAGLSGVFIAGDPGTNPEIVDFASAPDVTGMLLSCHFVF